jgi:putative membrane protein
MKINLNKTILALGFCALTSIASADDQNMQTSDMNTNDVNEMNGMAGMAGTSQGFVWMAATTDMKEIHMGEMALQKSDNSDVKSFARDIVSDHKKACKKLTAIAEKEGLNYPGTNSMAMNMNDRMSERWHTNYNSESKHPTMERQNMDSPPHLASMLVTTNVNDIVTNQQMVGHEMMNWDSLSGVEFDRAFINHMVMGHEKAISKFEMASENLQDADLKKYAQKTLPVLREHLRMAQKLQSKLGWSDSGMTNSTYQNASYQNR